MRSEVAVNRFHRNKNRADLSLPLLLIRARKDLRKLLAPTLRCFSFSFNCYNFLSDYCE